MKVTLSDSCNLYFWWRKAGESCADFSFPLFLFNTKESDPPRSFQDLKHQASLHFSGWVLRQNSALEMTALMASLSWLRPRDPALWFLGLPFYGYKYLRGDMGTSRFEFSFFFQFLGFAFYCYFRWRTLTSFVLSAKKWFHFYRPPADDEGDETFKSEQRSTDQAPHLHQWSKDFFPFIHLLLFFSFDFF